MEILLKQGSQNFELLNHGARWIKFSELINIKNKLNLAKIGDFKLEDFSQTKPLKIRSF